MDDVFLAVMLFSVDDGLADVRPGCEYAQSAALAVVHARHGLLGVDVYQRNVRAGVGHPALDLHLLVVRQDVVAEGHHRRNKGDVGIWGGIRGGRLGKKESR